MALLNVEPCSYVPLAPIAIAFTTAALSMVLCLVSVTGNILVVLAVFINPNKDLKSSFYYFVLNLAICDLLIGLVVDPLSVATHYGEGAARAFPFDQVYIRFPYLVSCTASVLSLAALTMDRYWAITSPISYRIMFSPKRVGLVAAGIWVVSIGFPFTYLFTGNIDYAFVSAHISAVATFLAMLLTYLRIVRVLKRQIKQWDTMNDGSTNNQAKRRAILREQKISKTCLIVLALFLACYLPSCVCLYISSLCFSCSCSFIHGVKDFHFLLILTNSSVNPFVYAWKFEKFRRAFVKILVCRKKFQSRPTIRVYPFVPPT